MKEHLLELSQNALESMNRGDFESAAKALNELLEQQPNWEHGGGVYNLACCLEELGLYDDAKQKFEQALNYEPRNPIFLGGLASFLYLHGDPREAFAKHLALIKLERSLGNEAKVLSIARALRTLGQRIGLPPAAVDGLIDES